MRITIMLGGLFYWVVRDGFTDTATFQQKPKEMRGIQSLWVQTVAMTKDIGLESQFCVLMGTVLEDDLIIIQKSLVKYIRELIFSICTS